MAANNNGFWDFKTYDEKTWFRFLVWTLSGLLIGYIVLHVAFYKSLSNYEYSRLSQDQMQLINRIYMDADTITSDTAVSRATASRLGKPHINKCVAADTTKPCLCLRPGLCQKTMDYLSNTFDGKLDKCQVLQIRKFLCEASSQEATAFLNGTRFRVRSYFWLIGPSVYWEVYFWSIFGVLSSLLFILGAVGSNATTDLGNPKSKFDSSEIYGQVAKLFYAPLCTLAVVFGYNYFKDQNVVDISSSKGIIAFAFIGGFYSSRIIALMDRLKDVLLPNSGTSALPTVVTPFAVIAQVTVKLQPDPTLPPAVLSVLTPAILNSATVQMNATGSTNNLTGSRMGGDPDGTFSFSSVQPGNYTITAALQCSLPDSSVVRLAAQQPGNIMSANAPIILTLQQQTAQPSNNPTPDNVIDADGAAQSAESTDYKFGKLQPKLDARSLQMSNYMLPGLPALPAAVSWQGQMPADSGMMGNDRLNDCSVAAAGHQIMSWTANALSQPTIMSDQAILDAYTAICGYDQANNQDDNGAYCLDVLNHWRNVGIGADVIEAYTVIDFRDLDQVKRAIYLFGGAYAGFALPDFINSASVSVWDIPTGGAVGTNAPNPAHGHTVPLIGYDATCLYFVTWGRIQRMTWAFYQAYADEAYAVLSATDWINHGNTPAGFDLGTLRNDLYQIDNPT